MSDGTLEFVPTHLRAHRVIKCGWDELHQLFRGPVMKIPKEDILLVKVEGTKEQLSKVNKKWLGEQYESFRDREFRLDLIPLETTTERQVLQKETSQPELLDALIDSISNASDLQKKRLKALWRDL
jgi:hypothetical protein